MSDITARQQRILDFIAETVRERGYPPTVREIGEAVGLTSSSSRPRAAREPRAQGSAPQGPDEAAGDDPRARRAAADGTAVPLAGPDRRRRAGPGGRARRGVPRGPDGLRPRSGDHFALRVAGDSMIGAGILDGDVVVIH